MLTPSLKEFPRIDGLSTIGFSAPLEGWRAWFLYSSPTNLAGYPNDGSATVDMIDGKWVASDYITDNITYDVFSKYNEAYRRGLFDPEIFVQTFDQYIAKVASGRVLGLFEDGWQFAGAQDVLRKEKPSRQFIAFPITLGQEHEEYFSPATLNYGFGLGITNKAKDPVGIIKFLDRVLREDIAKLAEWGVEGEDYLLDENGVFYRTPEMREAALDPSNELAYKGGSYTPYYPIGLYGTFKDGNAIDPRNQPQEFYDSLMDDEKEVLDAYGAKTFAGMFNPPNDSRYNYYPLWSVQVDQDNDQYQIESGFRSDIVLEYFPKLIMAEDKTEYETQFKAMKTDYASKITSHYLDTLQSYIDYRSENWK